MTRPSGFLAPGFAPVEAAFTTNFTERGEVGASFCAYAGGRLVADLWGGEASPGRPWEAGTMAVVFSCTKGAAVLTIQALVEQQAIDLEAPISSYWPEFGVGGKASITIRQVLTHTSGVIDFPGYREVVNDPAWWHDPDAIAASFAGAEPAWPPGTAHGYHGTSFGLLLGEVVRRATGQTLGEVFRTRVQEPLGLEFHIGLPDEARERVAILVDPSPPADPVLAAYLAEFNPRTLTGRAHFCGERGMMDMARRFNRPEMWSVEFPSGGGIGNARALATMYACLAAGGSRGGHRVVSEASLSRFTAETRSGKDLVLLYHTRYGLGYQLPTPYSDFGPSPSAFGHGGLGGSVGFADPVRQVAVGYVANRLVYPAPGETTRTGALIAALYDCLG